jgi:hypothetical protein
MPLMIARLGSSIVDAAGGDDRALRLEHRSHQAVSE